MATEIHSPTCRPSNSELLLACSASRQFFINLPYEEPGEAARYGSQVHLIAETIIKKCLKVGCIDEQPKEVKDVIKDCDLYDDDMFRLANTYAGACIGDVDWARDKTGESPFVMVEQTLDLNHLTGGKEKMVGTLDFGFMTDDTLVIEDLKTGRVQKNAGYRDENGKCHINPQLACYTSGVLAMYGFLYPIKKIRLVIHQERINSVSEFECSLEEFQEYENTVLIPGIALAFDSNPKATVNKMCKYCPGAAVCAERKKQTVSIMESNKGIETMTDAEIDELLPKLDDLVSFANDVKEYAIERMKSGVKYPHHKLVYSKTTRKISDETKVVEILKENGIEPYGEAKLLGITELTKKLGKARFNELISPYVEISNGSITIAAVDDAREEVNIDLITGDKQI